MHHICVSLSYVRGPSVTNASALSRKSFHVVPRTYHSFGVCPIRRGKRDARHSHLLAHHLVQVLAPGPPLELLLLELHLLRLQWLVSFETFWLIRLICFLNLS